MAGMDIIERLEKLEDAHRALSAQHLALQTTCRALLPLICAPIETIERLLQTASDVSRECMDTDGIDAEFQADVQQWQDVLAGDVLAARKPANPKAGHGGVLQ